MNDLGVRLDEMPKAISPETEEFDGFLLPATTARDLRKSVGDMQLLIAQMARLIRDTRQQMEEMQSQQRQVTVNHGEVKKINAVIRAAAADFCDRHGFTDPADARAVRADIRKTVLGRWQVKDLHDIPQIALGNVYQLIGNYGNIRLVFRLREKHREVSA